MVEIKLTWHCILLIILLVCGLIKVFTLSDRGSYLGSDRTFGCIIYLVISALLIVLYGGIFWW